MKANFNDDIILYPSKKGWKKIQDLSDKKWGDQKFSKEFIDSCRYLKGGFRIPLWQFIAYFGTLCYHGTNDFETMDIKIKKT